MKGTFINFNDQIVPADALLFSADNRGFKYGDGLFESMRLMKNEVKFINQHADRLQKGMRALKMDGYSQMDTWFLRERAEVLASRNKCKHGRIRLTVYRDSEGLYTPLKNKTGFCMELH